MFGTAWDLVLFAADQPARPNEPTFLGFLPLVFIGIAFYLMLIVPHNRERKTRDVMQAGLKKNDRVLTASGIFGTIANIGEGEEVTVKVDDNCRIRMLRSSIVRVISSDQSAEKSPANPT